MCKKKKSGQKGERMIFGELKRGDCFIVFPSESDYKEAQNLYRKRVLVCGGIGYPPRNATNLLDGSLDFFDDNKCVIKIFLGNNPDYLAKLLSSTAPNK